MDKIWKTRVLRNSTKIQQFRCTSCALALDCVGSMKHDLWCPGNNSVERNLLVVVETLTWRLAYQMRIEGFLISNHMSFTGWHFDLLSLKRCCFCVLKWDHIFYITFMSAHSLVLVPWKHEPKNLAWNCPIQAAQWFMKTVLIPQSKIIGSGLFTCALWLIVSPLIKAGEASKMGGETSSSSFQHSRWCSSRLEWALDECTYLCRYSWSICLRLNRGQNINSKTQWGTNIEFLWCSSLRMSKFCFNNAKKSVPTTNDKTLCCVQVYNLIHLKQHTRRHKLNRCVFVNIYAYFLDISVDFMAPSHFTMWKIFRLFYGT